MVQVIILLDFVHAWNDSWVAKDEQKWFALVPIVNNFIMLTDAKFQMYFWVHLGLLLYLLYRLRAILVPSYSRGSYSCGSIPLAMTVV